MELRFYPSAMHDAWSHTHEFMDDGLPGQPVTREKVYRAGPFQPCRFITPMRLRSESHIGEYLARADGVMNYPKTYRFSTAQQNRAFLLQTLAAHNWNPDATVAFLKQSDNDFLLRVDNAGFAYSVKMLLQQQARSRRSRWG
ncbi:MAG: hypothetical protein JXR76_23095 [Deltaproteobacteria bacterium]|nr:hypothetical protein [Deltaproteobacteria bacterium]